jgi:hypothetical protein
MKIKAGPFGARSTHRPREGHSERADAAKRLAHHRRARQRGDDRGYTCDLIVLDEAARIDDKEFNAVIPCSRTTALLSHDDASTGSAAGSGGVEGRPRDGIIGALGRSSAQGTRRRARPSDHVARRSSRKSTCSPYRGGRSLLQHRDFDRAIDLTESALCL